LFGSSVAVVIVAIVVAIALAVTLGQKYSKLLINNLFFLIS
jgi:hypothetical protein